MSNLVNTTVDLGTVQVRDCEFRDELLNLAGADELVEGTILARHNGTLKLQLYVKGGSSNENGIPKVVLAHAVSAAGSGDVAVRVISGGIVNKNRLVIDADGDDSNIDNAVIDQLRSFAIVPVNVANLGWPDNPQPEPIES
jgi:hypothetical protein